ncbi:MAG TPA: prepilin-type N-terminal cleavage/methylation domain-containing protein [Rudaea sp.]|nr:prepilin-type N-terminal cleavage/methylation domain-containing protein [Rudaea sp.]
MSTSLRHAPAARVRHGNHGFTLIEVLMAILLLALLIAGAYAGIHSAVKAMRAGEASIDRTDSVRTAQQFLRRQIEHILPLAISRDPNTGETTVFEGDQKFMRFVALMPGYLSRGGPYVQTLELARGKDGLQLEFTDTMLNGYDAQDANSGDTTPVVLLDHIREGRFEYRSLDDQGQLADWSSAWPDASVTPLLVRIDLTMQSGAQAPWPTLDVPLLLNAGATRPRFRPTQIRSNGGR